MPTFTPKFVDLVRNAATVSGTGAVTVGSAVSGFTSLAAAVSVGDQFYYCIQGIDKPAEREVGRGTMQANGTIARDPISGVATSFTSGAKTIAMVAAAEWFARLEGLANSGGGSSSDAATRAALAARTTTSGAVQLTEPGREGQFTFSTANLSAKVAADPRQGLCIAPASDPTGASGAWLRTFDGAVNVRWFGAAGDGVTDDLPAFNAALACLKAYAPANNRALFKASPKLYVPTTAKHYYLSGTLNLFQCVHLYGDGSGAPNSIGTALRFGDNCNGIVFNDYRTNNDGPGSIGDASGALVEGLCLFGGNVGYNAGTDAFVFGDGTSTSGHGIRIRATGCRVKNVQCQFWAGDGVNIVAYSGTGGATEGNANGFLIEDIWCFYNDGSGLFVEGNDANAGTTINVNAIQNRLWGVYDKSFLGNTHIQPHTRDNGLISSAIPPSPTGMCVYGGQYYCVLVGQEAAASTTVPGTNGGVWTRADGAHPFAKPWVSGMAWAAGGPFGNSNPNSCCTFLNAYSESGQGPIQNSSKSLFMGGLRASRMVGADGGDSGADLLGISGDLVTQGRFKAASGAVLGGLDQIIAFESGGAAGTWQLKKTEAGGKLGFLHNGSDFFSFDSNSGATAGAFTAFRLRLSRPNAGVLGGLNQEVGFINATAQINGRVVTAGDSYFNYAPAIGGHAGWVVTSGGTVGSSAVLTPTGIVGGVQAAAQADSNAATIADLKNDFNALLARLRTARLVAA